MNRRQIILDPTQMEVERLRRHEKLTAELRSAMLQFDGEMFTDDLVENARKVILEKLNKAVDEGLIPDPCTAKIDIKRVSDTVVDFRITFPENARVVPKAEDDDGEEEID